MASERIDYNPIAIGGIHLANAVRYTTLAKQEAARAQSIAASVTAGGAEQANLEGSEEFDASTGQGAVLYSAIVSLQTSLDAIPSTLLANLDQGG